MKPNYKNWVPKGLLVALAVVTAVVLLFFLALGVLGTGVSDTARGVLAVVLGLASAVCLVLLTLGIALYRAFDYNGKRQMARAIVDGVAQYVHLPDGGCGLDVGCGSGALTIACAKRNPEGSMTGVDLWGITYASYNKKLCEDNALAEGVSNVRFLQGNAVKLDFPDESFDAVTSNYCYHNIVGVNRQDVLLETLRVLKKGGTFALHDLMSRARYGDMQAFVERLRAMGYQEVQIIDTTQGLFMSPREAKFLFLGGSTLLVGRK